MEKLQYALIKDNCTFKESPSLNLRPPLELETKFALNSGPIIGRRVTLSAKLSSSNDMKSACNGLKQKVNNILNLLRMITSSATMNFLIVSERTPTTI